ncbi:hypothetical protein DEI92_11445 [Curtobacterium sp. MCBD17_034]|uniref:TetR/AcrR family transcriptional regulator n=1 Tax=unclassified Curtobacterium TaxID=257496 RepID=UPI000DA9BED3|nr:MULTISPECIES: TetR/AcrR family transcriptional regulator [unclassified Curtobacterium]PZF58646.1 hypothetical protein DEI92_11445 [Curtobacterium sp. MCBD17_034]PZM34636.1 hypothetical protein DEI90_08015 [Curtobacterium sp. MCBD17_031]
MPRRPDPSIKPAIVERVAAHLRATPIEAVTLRGVGRALGTSAYPLVYHFGSRDALVDAVVEHLERTCDHVELDSAATPTDLRSWFREQFGNLGDPDRYLAARLTFELGATEPLRGGCRHRPRHDRQVASVVAWCRHHDVTDPERRGREAVLYARGVQWGGVLDGDQQAADQALHRIARTLALAAGRADAAVGSIDTTGPDAEHDEGRPERGGLRVEPDRDRGVVPDRDGQVRA